MTVLVLVVSLDALVVLSVSNVARKHTFDMIIVWHLPGLNFFYFNAESAAKR